MTLFKLTLKSLWHRRLSMGVSLLSIVLSLVLIMSLERIRVDVKSSFNNTVSGTHLIVGARTGDIQLLLASVFHLGHLSTPLSEQSYHAIRDNKQVAFSIPLSFGDSYKGFRTVGTTTDFFNHFKYGNKQALSFSQGEAFSHHNLVVGAEVAHTLGLTIGDEITLAHGTGAVSFHHHDEHPLPVVGVLAATGTPVDKAIYTDLHTLAELHDSHSTAISALLVGMHSPVMALPFQYRLNRQSSEALSAILPTQTLSQLWQIFAHVEWLLFAITLIVFAVSVAAMSALMLATMPLRERELALFRMLGARPWHIAGVLLLESLLLWSVALVSSILILKGLSASLGPLLQSQFAVNLSQHLISTNEAMLLLGCFAMGLIAALVVAIRAYRQALDVSSSRQF